MNFHWNHFHSNLFWPNYVNCENCFLFHFGLVGVLSVFFFVYIKFICCRFNGRDHLIYHFLTSLLSRNIFLCIVNFQLANYICKLCHFSLLIFLHVFHFLFPGLRNFVMLGSKWSRYAESTMCFPDCISKWVKMAKFIIECRLFLLKLEFVGIHF